MPEVFDQLSISLLLSFIIVVVFLYIVIVGIGNKYRNTYCRCRKCLECARSKVIKILPPEPEPKEELHLQVLPIEESRLVHRATAADSAKKSGINNIDIDIDNINSKGEKITFAALDAPRADPTAEEFRKTLNAMKLEKAKLAAASSSMFEVPGYDMYYGDVPLMDYSASDKVYQPNWWRRDVARVPNARLNWIDVMQPNVIYY